MVGRKGIEEQYEPTLIILSYNLLNINCAKKAGQLRPALLII